MQHNQSGGLTKIPQADLRLQSQHWLLSAMARWEARSNIVETLLGVECIDSKIYGVDRNLRL